MTAPQEDAATEAVVELRKAREKHGPMASAHEGYAVILEELDELWEAVRGFKCGCVYEGPLCPKHGDYRQRCRKEAIQVAAMALRFVEDVCDK